MPEQVCEALIFCTSILDEVPQTFTWLEHYRHGVTRDCKCQP